MSRPKLIKKLDVIGVKDELLRDFIDRGLDEKFIIEEIQRSITSRGKQIYALKKILKELIVL